ncbi:hypothetical protein HAX54_004213 [Datura stramonium]|uniref:Uncharacterized protein n=1 Tax=Datura stramonium TaxID=4076 RepID=A0ABS8WXB5_DATST|nr:hypothetical protein [Datura stramonium]
MAEDTEVAIIDQTKNPEEEDSGAHGEVLRLRQKLAEWNRAWAQFSISAPGYTLCHLYPGTSTVRAPAPQHRINSYPAPPVSPAFVAPPPPEIPLFTVRPSIVLPRSASELVFNTHDVQNHPPEPTFKAIDPYGYIHQPEFSFEIEKPVKTEEREEIAMKMKALSKL